MKFGKSKNSPAVYEDVTSGLKKIYKVNSELLQTSANLIPIQNLLGLFATIRKGICLP